MTEQVFGGESHSGHRARPVGQAMWRGMLGRCPHCGEGRLYRSFIKTVEDCETCAEHIGHHRADDFPAYLVVFIVGHIVVGAFMGVEAATNLALWQHLAIWLPLTILACLLLLRPIKGAIVGLQWALYMHGFGGEDDRIESHPEL